MIDEFDTPDEPTAEPPKADPMRPVTRNGRYPLPHPVTGKKQTWMRVSNLIKRAEDTYHLELWKQRNVAKGLAMRPDLVEEMQGLDVKEDKARINSICSLVQDIAGAYKMSDRGTELHKSTELADFAGGDVSAAPPDDRKKVQMYLDALRVNGLTVADGMIERVVVSTRYKVAGTFDRIFQMEDGSYVLGDVKTGNSVELAMPSISGQLASYQDGINEHGIWDGSRYDTSIKVREDFALVVHLPSTRDEVSLISVDLGAGHRHNEVCVAVRDHGSVKAKHVAKAFDAALYRAGADAERADEWLELLNAAHTVPELISIAERARVFGHWNERLAGQARLLAAELKKAEAGMGS